MGKKNKHHHHEITSFNPACCFIIPSTARVASKRCSGDASVHSSHRSPGPAGHQSQHGPEADDPSSPRIGCVGQIKRDKSSSSSPSPSPSPIRSPPAGKGRLSNSKAMKLKALLHMMNLLSPRNNTRRIGDGCDEPGKVSVVSLSPPLPAVRADDGRVANAGSLWKRRCAGLVLENLELHQPVTGA